MSQCRTIFVKAVIIDQLIDLFGSLSGAKVFLDPLFFLLTFSLEKEGVGPAEEGVYASSPEEILLIVSGKVGPSYHFSGLTCLQARRSSNRAAFHV